jgi:hypothetical protein
MDNFSSLWYPALLVLGSSWFFFRDGSKSGENNEESQAFDVEKVSINIFQGPMSRTIEIMNNKTPQEIAEIVHKGLDLSHKQVVVSCRGRKLVNDMSIGIQGIRNGDFFHIVVSEVSNLQGKKSKSKKKPAVLALGVFLILAWSWFLTSEEIPNFFVRMCLIAFTELEVYLVAYTKL